MSVIRYTMRVEVSQPLRAADDESDDYPLESYAVTLAAKGELERAVLACLRKLEQECTDCEVMSILVEDE
jgi:hypothetical protein